MAVAREPQCGRVWQFLGTCTRSSHVGCLAVGFLDLPYHVVVIGQVFNTGDVTPAHWYVCLTTRDIQARRAALMACTECCDSKILSAQSAVNSTSKLAVKIYSRIHSRSHQWLTQHQTSTKSAFTLRVPGALLPPGCRFHNTWLHATLHWILTYIAALKTHLYNMLHTLQHP